MLGIVCLTFNTGSAVVPSPACESCMFVTGIMQDVARNASDMKEFVALMDAGCNAAFANDPASLTACDLIVAAAEALAPWLDSQMETLAWDEPEAICALFGQCMVPCCDSEHTPEQIRLSFNSSDISTMRVTWVTLNTSAAPQVQYGVAGGGNGVLPFSASALSSTYTFAGWLGVLHSTVMTGLQPGTKYSYRVGDAATLWSEVYNFTTMPTNVGTPARPLRVVQIGDMG